MAPVEGIERGLIATLDGTHELFVAGFARSSGNRSDVGGEIGNVEVVSLVEHGSWLVLQRTIASPMPKAVLLCRGHLWDV